MFRAFIGEIHSVDVCYVGGFGSSFQYDPIASSLTHTDCVNKAAIQFLISQSQEKPHLASG